MTKSMLPSSVQPLCPPITYCTWGRKAVRTATCLLLSYGFIGERRLETTACQTPSVASFSLGSSQMMWLQDHFRCTECFGYRIQVAVKGFLPSTLCSTESHHERLVNALTRMNSLLQSSYWNRCKRDLKERNLTSTLFLHQNISPRCNRDKLYLWRASIITNYSHLKHNEDCCDVLIKI